MKFRVRGPSRQTTVEMPSDSTIGELKTVIRRETEVTAFTIKRGFPPQPFEIDYYDESARLDELSINLNREQLIVSPLEALPDAPPPAPPPSSAAPPIPPNKPTTTSYQPPQKDTASDPPELPLPSHKGTLVMRVMPDDNSCLFRAISSATLGTDLDSMHELRSIVASAIRDDPSTYSAAILGKDPAAYCRWIQSDDAWGGAIEIGILASFFNIEIASISVRDGRVDRFNEGAPRRALLVYSQIHYDVLALAREDSLGLGFRKPPEQDVKLFEADDDVVLTRAMELCALLRERGYFTDTARFKILCHDCGWTGEGEKALAQHASETGHGNFGETSA